MSINYTATRGTEIVTFRLASADIGPRSAWTLLLRQVPGLVEVGVGLEFPRRCMESGARLLEVGDAARYPA